MQTKNPFNPTFGDVPNIFLDKQKQVDELIQPFKLVILPVHSSLLVFVDQGKQVS